MSRSGERKPLVRMRRTDGDGRDLLINPAFVEYMAPNGETTGIDMPGSYVQVAEPLESLADRLGFRIVDHVDDPETEHPSPEASAAEIPLAVGQVWASDEVDLKVEITKVEESRIYYQSLYDGRQSSWNPWTFRETFPIPVLAAGAEMPKPEPTRPVPLAVGQVWEKPGPDGRKATILRLTPHEYKTEVWFNRNDIVGEWWLFEDSFRHTYPIPISPAPEPDSQIPLAVGQVWGSTDNSYRATITAINLPFIKFDANSVYRIGADPIVGDRHFELFRQQYPTLISPAPEPRPQPPSRDDLIAALVDGKRLRFERDPDSDCRGPWDTLIGWIARLYEGVYRGTFGSGPAHVFATVAFNLEPKDVAEQTLKLAESLGYRVVSVDNSD